MNVEKTELVMFKSPRKVLLDGIKIKLSGKRLYPSNSVKYLGTKIDRFLHWHDQVNSIAVKLDTLSPDHVSYTFCFLSQKSVSRVAIYI